MNRTLIAAILFAISVSNVNAQQTTILMGSPQQYYIAPSSSQYYQVQVPQYRIPAPQYYQPQYPQYQLQSSHYGYYQPQTMQSYQQQTYVPQQDTIPTYYYPQSDMTGTVVQTLPTASADLENVVQDGLQQVETPQVQQDQNYLALPTQSRPPAPSIPWQPGDPIGPAIEAFAGQPAQPIDKTISIEEPLDLQAKMNAPVPATPVQSEEVAGSTEIVAATGLQKPMVNSKTSSESQSESFVADLAIVPENDLLENDLPETDSDFKAEDSPFETEELAATEAMSADHELAVNEELSTNEDLANEELANASELSAIEQLDELSSTDELASTKPTEVAKTELGLDDDIDQPKLEVAKLSFDIEEVIEPAASVANDEFAIDESTTNDNAQTDLVQSTDETKTEVLDKTDTDMLASAVTASANAAATDVALVDANPEQLQRSSSYGGWTLALIPILGLPLIGWLLLRKKRKNDEQRRLTEAALHNVNAKKSTSSLSKTVVMEKPVALPMATASVDENAEAAKVAEPIDATLVDEAPVEATLVDETPVEAQAIHSQVTKTLPPSTVTPATDASLAGVLSMDDLKEVEGVDLGGTKFVEKTLSDAEPKSSVKAEAPSAPRNLPRTELKTETINKTDRDCLTSISGINDATQHALYKAGYLKFSDLAKASERELQLALSKLNHRFSSTDFSRWIAKAAMISQENLEADANENTEPSILDKAISAIAPASPKFNSDDLTKIRGIGPATAELLTAAGITTFNELGNTETPRLQEILDSGGEKFAVVDPSLWSAQVEFLMSGSEHHLDAEAVADKTQLEVGTAWKPITNSVSPAPMVTVSIPDYQLPTATATTSEADSTSKPAREDAETAQASRGTVETVKAATENSRDDLTKIAGVNSAAQEMLRKNSIERFEQVAGMTASRLKELLSKQDSSLQSLDPTNWPVQARALMSYVDDESDVLAQVNSILDIAKSSPSNAAARLESQTIALHDEKAISE